MIDNVLKNDQPQYETASVFERAVALLFDVLMFASVYLWSSYVLIMKLDWITTPTQNVVIYISFNILFILYCSVLSSGGRQTLGKFLIGIKVVSKEGQAPLSFVKAFIRTLGYYAGFMTFFGGFTLALFNKNNRALQDLISGSMVVSVREKTAAEATAIAALGTFLIALMVFYVYFILFMLPSPFQKARVQAAQEQVNRLAYLQEMHKENFGYYTADLVRLGLISGDAVQLQRDIQHNLRRRGFSLGVTTDGYKISAIAKDGEETVVTAEK
jgi:uncharacterized RDD family membrane protein YckC